MKRLFLILFAITAIAPMQAKTGPTDLNLSFVYIAHDENTPVSTLVSRLQSIYYDALTPTKECAAIFYLPNGEHPLVVCVNTGDDNRAAFGELMEELQTKRSHDIDPIVDMERIQSIFAANDIVHSDGKPRFKSVDWTYYVNSTFWSLGYNEYVISSLFWIMDMEQMVKSKYLKLNIFYSKSNDDIRFNKEHMFGDKALCRSVNITPMPY